MESAYVCQEPTCAIKGESLYPAQQQQRTRGVQSKIFVFKGRAPIEGKVALEKVRTCIPMIL